jgi:hypothetical protein
MRATHFIEVWRCVGYIISYSGDLLYSEEELQDALHETRNHPMGNLETIAVWRIKPTDVPLQERMMLRKVKELSESGYFVDLRSSYSFDKDLGVINIEEELGKLKVIYADTKL